MSLSLGELAVRFGCELRGDPAVRVERVATLAGAGPGALSFLANPHYRAQLAATAASAVVLDEASAKFCPAAALICQYPHAIYARAANLLHPPRDVRPGIHPGAIVDPSAQIDAAAEIGAGAIVGAGCRIGAGSIIGAGCVLGEGVRLGTDCRLAARVTLERSVQLGARVTIHGGAVIGAEGFGFAHDRSGWVKVPQVGSVLIGDDVEIGANTTIDRGAIEDTVIEQGVKLDNQIQIGHNVRIGAHTVMAACTGVSGSTHIGQRCMIAGLVGIGGHLQICDDVVITGMAAITRSIKAPGMYSGAIPAEPARLWRRLVGRIKRLDTLGARVARLERSAGFEQAAEQEASDD